MLKMKHISTTINNKVVNNRLSYITLQLKCLEVGGSLTSVKSCMSLFVCTCVCVHVCVCVCVLMHAHMCECVYVWHVYMYLCMCVVQVCVYVYA